MGTLKLFTLFSCTCLWISLSSSARSMEIEGTWATGGQKCNSNPMYIVIKTDKITAFAKGKFVAHVAKLDDIVYSQKVVEIKLNNSREIWRFEVVDDKHINLISITNNGVINERVESDKRLLRLEKCRSKTPNDP